MLSFSDGAPNAAPAGDTQVLRESPVSPSMSVLGAGEQGNLLGSRCERAAAAQGF